MITIDTLQAFNHAHQISTVLWVSGSIMILGVAMAIGLLILSSNRHRKCPTCPDQRTIKCATCQEY